MGTCKGEYLLLQTRIRECKAATTLLDVAKDCSKASWEEILAALDCLKEHWDVIPFSMKAKLAELNLAFQMQLLEKCRADDSESCVVGIVECLVPVSNSPASFDGSNPTMLAAMSEVMFLVNGKFDLEAADVEDEEKESEAPCRIGLKAGSPLLLALFLLPLCSVACRLGNVCHQGLID